MMSGRTEPVSRRTAVAGLAAALGVAGALAAPGLPVGLPRPRSGSGASWWDRQYWTLEAAGLSEWNSQIGTSFRLAAAGRTVAMKLVAIRPMLSAGTRPANVGRARAFAAIFDTGAAPPALDDRIYSVSHPRYGEMSIFMAPGAAAAGRGRMVAVFN